jgi:hypothetical protein
MMMEMISTICLLVSLFGLLMTVISLFTSRTVWFSKNKSRKRGVLTWLAVSILALIVGGAAYTRTENAPIAPSPVAEEMEPAAELQESASEAEAESAPAAETPDPELQEPASEAEAESAPAVSSPVADTAAPELQESASETEAESAPVAPSPAAETPDPALQEPASEAEAESAPAAPSPAAETPDPALQEPASEPEAESAPAVSSPVADTAAPEPQEFDPEAEALRKAIAARVEEVKPELAALLRELEAMRDTPEFRASGFSADNQAAADWKMRVEGIRDRLKGDKGLPPQVTVVPTALLSLGTNYILRNNGAQNNADIEWDSEMIAAGLNWK